MIKGFGIKGPVLAAVSAIALATVVLAPPTVSGAQTPAITSPRIGTLYQGAVISGVWGISVFAQHADGSLTSVGQGYTEGLIPKSSAVIHLSSGKALYVLAGTASGPGYIFSFHIGSGGRLTPFASPVTASLGPSANKLAAYDPLGTGAAGNPVLVTGACATSLSDPTYCGAGLGTFAVDPATGLLGPESIGIVQSSDPTQLQSGPEMNAAGQLAFTAQIRPISGGWPYELFFEKIKVISGVSTLVSLTGRIFSYSTSGKVTQIQLFGEPIVTSTHYVQIDAGNLPGGVPGWLTIAFGSASGAPVTVANGASGGPNGYVNVETQSRILASGTTTATGKCRFNQYGKSSPGLGAVYYVVPCGGSYPSITAAIDLHGFVYVGRYAQPTLVYRDLGTSGITRLSGTLIPAGTIQAYSFSGF